MQNLRCDKEGVPLLVQSLKYNSGWAMFHVLFFNSKVKRFTCDHVGPKHLDLLDYECTCMQLLEVENNITNAAKTEWKEWFPIEREAVTL